jgi:hypothetical protein
MSGRLVEAGREVDGGLEIVRRTGAHGHLPPLLRLRAELFLRDGSPEDATLLCREALDLATALGLRPEVAHCHLGLGAVYRHTRQREQAHEQFTIARTMYRGLDMAYWLAQATDEAATLD